MIDTGYRNRDNEHIEKSNSTQFKNTYTQHKGATL